MRGVIIISVQPVRLLAGVLCYLGIMLAGQVNAQTTWLAEQRLLELLQPINQLQGSFVQTTQTSGMRPSIPQRGQFQLQRPDKIRWYTEEPWSQVLVVDGQWLWFYDIDLQQVTRRPWNKEMQGMGLTNILLKPESLSHHYRMTMTVNVVNKALSFELETKSSSAAIQTITLGFENQLLSTLVFRDHFDQTTRINFTKVTANSLSSTQSFLFEVPEGVELYDES